MQTLIRIARIVALLLLVLAIPYAVASIGGRYGGNRIYLTNNTKCRVVLMEQHDGTAALPGETILVKPGFLDRTPTMLIGFDTGILIGGLHFSEDRLQVRGLDDIAVPASWREKTTFGTKLTYELNARGQLLLRAAYESKVSSGQPPGLPVQTRIESQWERCIHG
jgi:hypothetical protein